MSEQPPASSTRSSGRVMMIIAWIIGIWLAARFFAQLEERQVNPNSVPVSEQLSDGSVEVILKRNRHGHYVASGTINGQPVVYLLDTGATDVAIPQALAQRLALERGAPVQLATANGVSSGYRTQLQRLTLGDLRLTNVRATVAPNLTGGEVLLGMSALKQLEFTQRGDELRLRLATSTREAQ
ncbi:retropepsin-like aspartic protease family protein [Atopomonas sediminilitoris]|uniref:retropepsin-like aspartic protease family protein n=1 Tax=Atopomonas sediminilitoris TaxID=2919919 RepID=UPI001F4EEC08|nr:TIGR02281 family clan AA aspartic protease [Atopomonas sediminilitoris]MCJ8168531.1 TIGR02281 family clan AA aspartic protease [Atopomonas sediminilitoris]